ncbi:hypothetical protein ACU4HD_15595 [Cupriavidus basilensis]
MVQHAQSLQHCTGAFNDLPTLLATARAEEPEPFPAAARALGFAALLALCAPLR